MRIRWQCWIGTLAVLFSGCSSGSSGGVAGTPSGSSPRTTGTVSAVEGGQEQKMPDKNELAERLRSHDPTAAEFVAAPESELTEVATPFFGQGGVVRVQRNLPTKPVLLFVGWGDNIVKVLTGKPEAFTELAPHAGLTLATPDHRARYMRTYFEATRVMSKRFAIVDDVAAIKARPNLAAADQARFEDIQKKHAATVRPLSMSDQPPYRGAVFAVKGQDLVRIDFDLGENGRVTAIEKLIEADLPIPYAR